MCCIISLARLFRKHCILRFAPSLHHPLERSDRLVYPKSVSCDAPEMAGARRLLTISLACTWPADSSIRMRLAHDEIWRADVTTLAAVTRRVPLRRVPCVIHYRVQCVQHERVRYAILAVARKYNQRLSI